MHRMAYSVFKKLLAVTPTDLTFCCDLVAAVKRTSASVAPLASVCIHVVAAYGCMAEMYYKQDVLEIKIESAIPAHS